MKEIKLTKNVHSSANSGIIDFLTICEEIGITVRFKLADRLEERGLTVRKCAELTGLRLGTISDIMNGNKTSITFQHIWILMIVLCITDINDLIELHLPEHVTSFFDEMSEKWIDSKEIPATSKFAGDMINLQPVDPLGYKRLMNFLEK
ncbi:helix-turn-helix transcriptional regulator [Clostridium perfringens]|uniref:helix-turn-helix domain-containing protein n=1 Tax=Clostridium perfringens TaxID=1502 RepID=UPI002977403E|nr:helix-turn-helix transcriptional regulator [Clostridium perfringens]MDK0835007.1 helix-turn-helix transcriptional regulator [Clostridium perfringens]MDK0928447.1 helix-turn-helix transcriptional regulator [Clostridium perfringens]MDM0495327.1 helix-turn-helix transcriptional regulator [Clostridium perfringens]MDM0781043.1 helix-turn-helix transcriptional regulator [Clostridium perfringens]